MEAVLSMAEKIAKRVTPCTLLLFVSEPLNDLYVMLLISRGKHVNGLLIFIYKHLLLYVPLQCWDITDNTYFYKIKCKIFIHLCLVVNQSLIKRLLLNVGVKLQCLQRISNHFVTSNRIISSIWPQYNSYAKDLHCILFKLKTTCLTRINDISYHNIWGPFY